MNKDLNDIAQNADKVLELITAMSNTFTIMDAGSVSRLCIMAGIQDAYTRGFGEGIDYANEITGKKSTKTNQEPVIDSYVPGKNPRRH